MIRPLVADLNHANPINVQKVAQAGLVAIIHKATEGIRFADKAYVLRRGLAKTYGLEWGAYDFNDGTDPKAQVDFFFKAAQPDERTVMVLDFEDNTRSEMSLSQAVDYLGYGDEKLGRPIDLYSGNRIKDLIIHAGPGTRALLAKRRLWLCEYGPRAKLIDANGHPLPWPAYWLWQYTGDGTGLPPHTVAGLENGADLNTFDGSPEELRATWTPAAPAPAAVASAPMRANPPIASAPPSPPKSWLASLASIFSSRGT